MVIAIKANALLALHQWPGCTLGYEIVRDGITPALRIIVRFDRTTGLLGRRADLTAWSSIRRHANDPSLEFAVACSFQGDVPVGEPNQAVAGYRALVDTLFRCVSRISDRPVTVSMVLPLDPVSIADRMETLSPLSVALTLARRRPGARGERSAIRERVRSSIAPWRLRSIASRAPLIRWARDAEAALAGYDGSGSRIQLARPAYRRGSLQLWGLRWGGEHGIVVRPGSLPAVVFAARPFAPELLTGSVAITVWDDALTPGTAMCTYQGIDVDAAFERAAAILDELGIAVATGKFGREHPSLRSRIEAARNAAALAFARRLIPVLAEHDDGDEAAEARREMFRAVRAGVAAIGAVWVQLAAETRPATRLRLRGFLSDVPSKRDAPASPVDVLLDGSSSVRLDFPADPRADDDQALWALQPKWTLTQVGPFASEARMGPTGRLVPVLGSAGEPEASLGELDVPPISPLFPEQPTISHATATGQDQIVGGTLAELVARITCWTLAFTVHHDGLKHLDDLWITVEFDQPHPAPAAAMEVGPALTPLAATLLRFEAGYLSVASLLTHSLVTQTALPDRLRRVVTGLVDDVTDAMSTSPAGSTVLSGTEQTPTWVWRNRPNPDGSRSLFVRDGSPFPVITGCAPLQRVAASAASAPDEGIWREAVYHLPKSVEREPLTFVLDRLDLLSHQTAIVSARVVRNAGTGFNPLLMRATGWSPTGAAIVPFIDVSVPFALPPGSGSLEESIAVALAPFCKAGDRTGDERVLHIDLAYRYPLTETEVLPQPIGTLPILSASFDPVRETSSKEIAANLIQACRAWAQRFLPSYEGTWLSLSAVLMTDIVGTWEPLLAVRQLDLPWAPNSLQEVRVDHGHAP